ncbi:hypothetical protein NDU88_001704 [Pleurodeles waltl]|uniref:Uncharacterized protein n=1 Tax=Pleurodeles waltl TaxID=8319 RepID=A0AAV7UB51_PLEWA|nr:hypothetical protein NDU88_001704 [Pleurodeles waltl]
MHSLVYQWEDKASKTVYCLCTPHVSGDPIAYTEADESLCINGSKAIAEDFVVYCQQLYSPDPVGPPANLDQFMVDLSVTHLPLVECGLLEVDVTHEELEEALAQLHSGKALGPNSLPGEFWRLIRRPQAVEL